MKSLLTRKFRAGFTLIELLLVIGIIAILASIVIVAINPTKQLGDARNAQRRSDVNTILNAVYQWSIDNGGEFPGCLSGSTALPVGSKKVICGSPSTGVTSGVCTAVTGRCQLDQLVSGNYIVDIPEDPRYASGGLTAYYISKDASDRVTVYAGGSVKDTSPTATDISVQR